MTVQSGISLLSPDERYLRGKLLEYTYRLVKKYPTILCADFLRYLWFVLDKDTLRLGLELLHGLEDWSIMDDEYDRLGDRWSPDRIFDQHDFCNAIEHWTGLSGTVRSQWAECALLLIEEDQGLLESQRQDAPVKKRLDELTETFKLNEPEAAVLEFMFIMEVYDEASSFFNELHALEFRGARYLACALGLPQGDVQKGLRGKLVKLGIIEADRYRMEIESEVFSPFLRGMNPDGFDKTSWFRKVDQDPIPLSAHFVDPAAVDQALRLLQSNRADSGVSILLYGPPGSGKTSFAMGLCRELGLPAYAVSSENCDGRIQRTTAVYAALNMHAETGVIIVDDADKMLSLPSYWNVLDRAPDKKRIHDLMDTPGRCIYICNEVCHIEPSIRRRFAFSIKFQSFTRAQRETFIRNSLSKHGICDLVSQEHVSEIARKYPRVSPGVMDISTEKAAAMGLTDPAAVAGAIMRAIDAHEELAGRQPVNYRGLSEKDGFTLEAVNTDHPGGAQALMELVKGADDRLKRADGKSDFCFHLLFHGKSGAGKSAFARHLAELLDRDLIEKRASDFLNPYVGVTERLIRETFDEADRKGAMLIIDEFETLVRSRGMAEHSWEASFTAEFLQAVETFHRGILIATTNRLEDVDEAMIRRFNLKVGFEFLKPEQCAILYERVLAPLASDEATERIAEDLATIHGTTPGDFKNVKDRVSLMDPDKVTHRVLLDELKAEVDVKRRRSGEKALGFAA
jgi:AAA+ superfamily predicted ATPase